MDAAALRATFREFEPVIQNLDGKIDFHGSGEGSVESLFSLRRHRLIRNKL